jgi:fucose permease
MSVKELNGNIIQRIKHYPKLGLVILVFVAFIALGMPDGLIGVAWPSIRASFSLPLDALGGLLFASVAGYLTSSFLSGRIMSFLGVGRLLAVSCTLTGIALIGYTLVPSWWMMVLLGVLSGLGAGGIDAGLNTYVAAHFSERLMQWLHASYGVGVTLGPLIMIFALNTFETWRAGYLIVGGFQLLLAVCFTITLPMWAQGASPAGSEAPKRLTDYNTSLVETLRQPRVWLSMGLFFLYTGAEVALGAWSYTLLTESRGVEPKTAALLVGSYWAMFTIGRIIAGLYTSRVGVRRLVLGGLVGALLGSALLWWNPGAAANLVGVGVIGFAIAPIFPGLVSRTSHRVSPRFAANTIGMQLAAAGLGTAFIPSLIGILSRRISLEIIPVCLAILFALQLGMFWVSEVNPAPRAFEKA